MVLRRCMIVWCLALGLLLMLGGCKSSSTNEARLESYFQSINGTYSYTVLIKKNLDSTIKISSLASVVMLNANASESTITESVVSGTVTDTFIDQLSALHSHQTIDTESLKAAKEDMIYVTIHVPQIPAGDTTFEFTVNFNDGTQTTVSDVVSQLSASFD